MSADFSRKSCIWLGLMLVVPLFGGCQKEENEQDEQFIAFKSIASLNECHVDIVNSENSDSYIVINSQEELDQHIIVNNKDQSACVQLSTELNVDFNKWTILIGKKRLTHIEGELIKQSVLRAGSDLIYQVNIKNGGYTAIGQFRFGVVIPKISNDTNVRFDVVVEL